MSDEGYQNDADQKFHEFHVSMGDRLKDNLYGSFILRVVNAFNKPVTYVRGNVYRNTYSEIPLYTLFFKYKTNPYSRLTSLFQF